MATVNLGNIKFNWKGTYNAGTAYAVDDVVSYNGSSYVCISATTGNLPTVTAKWNVMATAGTNGTDVGTTITTQGDLLYRDGSGLQRLAKPASDKFLQNTSGGVLSWADAGGGKILQVIEDIADGEFETSSSSFVATNLSVNITPSATSSKILIMAACNGDSKGNRYIHATLHRDSTELSAGNEGMQIVYTQDGERTYYGIPLLKLDSPNTTSQVTYSVKVRTNTGTIRIGQNNMRNSIVVMEVGA